VVASDSHIFRTSCEEILEAVHPHIAVLAYNTNVSVVALLGVFEMLTSTRKPRVAEPDASYWTSRAREGALALPSSWVPNPTGQLAHCCRASPVRQGN